MAIINRIADFHGEMTAWRQTLHAHPELGYEEVWTSDFIAEKLASFGIEVHRGLAKTGVVFLVDTLLLSFINIIPFSTTTTTYIYI